MDDEITMKFSDIIFVNHLIDLHASIAGITSGYKNTLIKNMSNKEAEEHILMLDKIARDKVEDAYKLFQNETEGDGS